MMVNLLWTSGVYSDSPDYSVEQIVVNLFGIFCSEGEPPAIINHDKDKRTIFCFCKFVLVVVKDINFVKQPITSLQ